MKTVTVVGSGMMGSSIAAMAARSGKRVFLNDVTQQKAVEGKEKSIKCLQELYQNDLLSEPVDVVAARIIPVGDLNQAVEGTDLVIEAVFENLELKQKMFKLLDSMIPAGIPICSNTSGLRITDIAKDVECHPERTMTTHFWMPAHLVPLVEVVLWDKTNPELASYVRDELTLWDKAPVLVKRDLPGQLANRILQAVIREASCIVESGLATAEDVDTAIKMGMGIRFPVWGPLEHVDAVGMELCRSVQNTVLPSISNSQKAADIFDDFIANGNLGYKSGKGFYDWSQKDMKSLEELRNSFIMNSIKFIKSHK